MRLRTPLAGFCWLSMVVGCEPGAESSRQQAANAPPDAVQQGQKPTPMASTRSEWQIRPGQAGPVDSRASEADLRRHYGPDAVDTARIQLGEGETTPGTVLYPGDTLRRAEIIWQDTVNWRRPARLILRGSRSEWHVDGPISLGTSLHDLERLNGKPFTLAGFGWDYAGVITDWRGGGLDSVLTGIKLYLDPGPGRDSSALYSQVLGDRDYSSTLPAMQQLNPRVAQIFVDFDQSADSAGSTR